MGWQGVGEDLEIEQHQLPNPNMSHSFLIHMIKHQCQYLQRKLLWSITELNTSQSPILDV